MLIVGVRLKGVGNNEYCDVYDENLGIVSMVFGLG